MKNQLTNETLADTAARNRIRTDLDTTLVVEAAAGTGKTSELVARMIAALKSGRARLNSMIAVTFTDAAAGELKLRLRAEIEKTRQDPQCPPDEKKRLTDALPHLEEARIGTIHSFCSDLLKKSPVEAGIDPAFEVAADEIASPLFDLAFDRWFERQLAAPGEAVRRILRRRMGNHGPKSILRAAAWQLSKRRDFPSPWRRSADFNRTELIDELIAEMKSLAAWASKGDPDDFFIRSLAELDVFVNEVTRTETVTDERDYDGIEARLTVFNRRWHSEWVGYKRKDDTMPKAELIERRNLLKQRMESFLTAAGADLAPMLRDDLWEVIEEYHRLKEQAGCLDFLDLLLRARDLVRHRQDIRSELQQRITHIYVDEFQDTDPLQAEILMLIAGNDSSETDWRKVKPAPGRLFIVGDPKQSIYRFRRADVELYEQVKQQVIAAGGAPVELSVSFRAVPEIQQAVNAAFSEIMSGRLDVGSRQARYTPLRECRPSIEGQPAVVALPAPAPYGDYGKIVKFRIEESLPDVMAAYAEWLVKDSGWSVSERSGNKRAIAPRDICMLFRRFRHFGSDVTRPYVRALEARGLPHLLVGGSSFHAREEVEAIRNALNAIERPDDELSLFATLKGPLFALSDSQLLSYRTRVSLNYFRTVPEDLPESLSEVVDALSILRELHRGRNLRPIANTIGRLLAETRAHAGLAIWPTGEQALANITRLMDMARRAERNGVNSFRAFVDWLEDQAQRGEASDAPIIEEGAAGVRLMTVHKAKGLEFPVVLLADMTAREAREPSIWSDPEKGLCVMKLAGCLPPELQEHAEEEMALERDEAARVLYVAATRARDLLVVPVVGDAPQDGWIGLLNRVVYPPANSARQPETSSPAGCPEFGSDSVPMRPQNAVRPADSVAPGLHKPEVGEHRVVWWDPLTLRLNVKEAVGQRQTRLLQADEYGIKSQAGIRAHAEWQSTRKRVRQQAGAPRVNVITATEHAASMAELPAHPTPEIVKPAAPSGDIQRSLFDLIEQSAAVKERAPAVSIKSAGPTISRPHGQRFGTLVHAVLSIVELNADRAAVEQTAQLQGRVLGATFEEIRAASTTVVRALAHSLLVDAREAASAGACRRESPITMPLEEGVVLEGVVDLAFLKNDEWVVVDFKTDMELGDRVEEYRRQAALYVEAISRATGKPARGFILKI